MKDDSKKSHPYLTGNYSPVRKEWPLTSCQYTGTIPPELYGGQYIRNGANPFHIDKDSWDLNPRDYHWFDGDGMLTGVYFQRLPSTSGASNAQTISPHFVNAYVLTDLYLHARTSPYLRRPLLPSISSFLNPLAGTLGVILSVLRAVTIVVLSQISAFLSRQQSYPVTKISVANTSIVYHDGRALATCESGPPMRILLPSLTTVGWFDGIHGDGDDVRINEDPSFGAKPGLIGWMDQWTTGHPRVDPCTHEMIMYHSTALPPYISYTIVPPSAPATIPSQPVHPRLRNAPIPGVHSPKLSHDFACTRTHTIILDLPLYLDPLNLLSLPSRKKKQVMHYQADEFARFGVFPRYEPHKVRWFEDVEGGACCIFHTVCAWDEMDPRGERVVAVNLLACRLDSAALVYSAGNLATPRTPRDSTSGLAVDEKEGKCELYYYRFDLSDPDVNSITHAFPLSTIPLEFPVVPPSAGMGIPTPILDGDSVCSAAASPRRFRSPQFVYGCSMQHGTFGAALGGSNARIDAIAKVDVHDLIERGAHRQSDASQSRPAVDQRTVQEILGTADASVDKGAITIFTFPPGHCGSEPSFCPRTDAISEDDGYLIFYVFDERQLERGLSLDEARSQLWVVDARNTKDVVCRVELPQRVPYGLHAHFFTEDEILGQRGVYSLRSLPVGIENNDPAGSNSHSDSAAGSAWYEYFIIACISWIGSRLG